MDYYWGKKTTNPCQSNKEDEADPQRIRAESSVIEIVRNNIYFYSEVERDKTIQLVKTLRYLNQEFELHQRKFREPPCIKLFINSNGGNIFAGFSAMDEIITSRIPIITIADGCCASAATLLSVVGKKRLIKAHSHMLIHQMSSMFCGKYQEFEDKIDNQRRIMEKIKGIYRMHTRIPENQLNEILKHDLWFDAKKCLEYGLVDEIIQGGKR